MMLNLHNTCILLHIWELLFVLFPTLFLLACFVQVVELLLFIRSISVATCLFFFFELQSQKKNYSCFFNVSRMLPLKRLVRTACVTAKVCSGICLWQGVLWLLSFVRHQHLCNSFSHYSFFFFFCSML